MTREPLMSARERLVWIVAAAAVLLGFAALQTAVEGATGWVVNWQNRLLMRQLMIGFAVLGSIAFRWCSLRLRRVESRDSRALLSLSLPALVLLVAADLLMILMSFQY